MEIVRTEIFWIFFQLLPRRVEDSTEVNLRWKSNKFLFLWKLLTGLSILIRLPSKSFAYPIFLTFSHVEKAIPNLDNTVHLHQRPQLRNFPNCLTFFKVVRVVQVYPNSRTSRPSCRRAQLPRRTTGRRPKQSGQRRSQPHETRFGRGQHRITTGYLPHLLILYSVPP